MIPTTIHLCYHWQRPPSWALRNVREWMMSQRGWEVRFWDGLPAELPANIRDALRWAPSYRFRSDLVRYWILQQYGGIYVDIDTRPIRPLDDKLRSLACFLVEHDEAAPHVDNFFMGAEPGHPALGKAIERCLNYRTWQDASFYFGTVNAFMDGGRLIDGVTALPARCAAARGEGEGWGELLDDPRPALSGVAYLKHYKVQGELDPQELPAGEVLPAHVRQAWFERTKAPDWRLPEDLPGRRSERPAAARPAFATPRRPVGKAPAISVVIPARNEGEEVARTVASARAAGADEVVVVDDGSTDGSCLGLEGATVIRHEQPRGQSTAREVGAQASSGRVILWLDAHMRLEGRGLQNFAAEVEGRNCIMCGTSAPMLGDGGHDWRCHGGNLQLSPTQHLQVKWNTGAPPSDFARIGAVIGACYAMPREVYRRMGGWPVQPGPYGFEEEALALAAWFQLIPIRVDRELIARHLYRKENPTPDAGKSLLLNATVSQWVAFGDQYWRSAVLPVLQKSCRAILNEATEIVKLPEWQARRVRFQARKVISDEEFAHMVISRPGRSGWQDGGLA